MNITKQIDAHKLELLLIATYYCGFTTRDKMYVAGSQVCIDEIKRIKELLYSQDLTLTPSQEGDIT